MCPLPVSASLARKSAAAALLATLFLLALLLVAPAGTSQDRPALAPTPLYATYIGAEAWDQANGLAVDQDGRAYLTGYTQSITFPLGLDAPLHGIDVFAIKVDPAGAALDYSLWFNALALFAEDYGYAIALDGDGNAYVAGLTNSDDFCAYLGPVPGFDTEYNGAGDVFVLKIRPDGGGLDYCTYLGSGDLDIARAIAVDGQGRAYVAGGTWSTDFYTTPGAFDTGHNGARDVFVTRLSADGTQVEYSTFLGGAGQEEATAIAVDDDGQATITGWVVSPTFPTTAGAFATGHSGGTWDTFVTRLDAGGSSLIYSTFVGGEGEDRGTAVALDAQGSAYVTGMTTSADFPATPLAFDTTYGGGLCSAAPCYDAFALKLSPDGDALAYATYLGDDGEDIGRAIAVDVPGRAFVAGATGSAAFPTTPDALDGSLGGLRDAFVAILDATGSQLLYGSFLGGSHSDEANALALGPAGFHVAGQTFSQDFPVTDGAYDPDNNGDYDIFVAAFALPEPPVYRLYLPLVVR